MPPLLADKTALITGGTSGIGEATVELFIAQGAKVVFTGRDKAKGAAIEKRLGSNAHFVQADAMQETQIKNAVETALNILGHIDILFNNAGAPVEGGIENTTKAQLNHAVDLLIGSVIFTTKYVVPHMKAQKFGRIINNSSIAAHRTHNGRYLYSAVKAAVSHLTRVAGMELGRYGITANAISPGLIITPLFIRDEEGIDSISPEHFQAKLNKFARIRANSTPLMHAGQPKDIANAALYLASEMGSFVNCQDLVVDGGATAAGCSDFSEAYNAG